MTSTFPPHIQVTVSPNLFFKKFPHKVTVKLTPNKKTRSLVKINNVKINNANLEEIDDHLLKITNGDSALSRSKLGKNKKTYFLLNESDVHSLLALTEERKWQGIEVSTMNASQAQASADDHKLIYRKSLFYKKYQWKINIRELAFDDWQALESQFFNKHEIESYLSYNRASIYRTQCPRPLGTILENRKARIVYGASYYHTILYFAEDDDVSLARLMLPGSATVVKAVVA